MDFATVKEAWSSIASAMPVSEKINTAWIDALIEVGSSTQVQSDNTIIALDDKNTDAGYLLLTGDYSIEKEGSPELRKSAPELLGELGRLNPTHRRTATVRAVTNVTMIIFGWGAINTALKKRLSDSEFQQLSDGLQQYAWGHFAE